MKTNFEKIQLNYTLNCDLLKIYVNPVDNNINLSDILRNEPLRVFVQALRGLSVIDYVKILLHIIDNLYNIIANDNDVYKGKFEHAYNICKNMLYMYVSGTLDDKIILSFISKYDILIKKIQAGHTGKSIFFMATIVHLCKAIDDVKEITNVFMLLYMIIQSFNIKIDDLKKLLIAYVEKN